jgi:hypothetical protein
LIILVDDAVWPWRGRYWAHLVSDRSLAELHAFAGKLGMVPEWFQGDHYDIHTVGREQAIALGAEAVNARELVRRLREAGLRRRGRKSPVYDDHPPSMAAGQHNNDGQHNNEE